MSFIAVCGGGGKTTICRKYPTLFLDIDDFIGGFSEYNGSLEQAVNESNHTNIVTIYETIMKLHGDKLDKSRIILGHHPKNAEILGLRHLCSVKPSRELHAENIKMRDQPLKDIAVRCWNELDDALVYNSHEEFEKILMNMWGRTFHDAFGS
jgi:hypothetical protein